MATPYEVKTYLQADTLAVAGLEEVGGQAINSSVTLTTVDERPLADPGRDADHGARRRRWL